MNKKNKGTKSALYFLLTIFCISFVLLISPKGLLPQNITNEAINQIKFIKLESNPEDMNSPNIVQTDIFNQNEIKKIYECFSDIKIYNNIKILNDNYNSMVSFIWVSIFYEENGKENQFSFKIDVNNKIVLGELGKVNHTYSILWSDDNNKLLLFSKIDGFMNSTKKSN